MATICLCQPKIYHSKTVTQDRFIPKGITNRVPNLTERANENHAPAYAWGWGKVHGCSHSRSLAHMRTRFGFTESFYFSTGYKL